MLCIGCVCHRLPGAILPEGFEAIRSIEADISVLENLSFSLSATISVVSATKVLHLPVLPVKEYRRKKEESEVNISSC